jgi:hypothetical protein
VKTPKSFIFLYVSLGTFVGRKIKPSVGGLDPKCVTELTTATLESTSSDMDPNRFADLKPEQLFIKLILNIFSKF